MKERSTDVQLRSFLLDGEGGAKAMSWDMAKRWKAVQGPLWVHLDFEDEAVQTWLREDSGLDEVTCDALLADETRPQSRAHDDGLIVILRGVNLNPGADPEDMVSIRLWVDAHRMVSLSRRRLLATSDMSAELSSGRGPKSSGELLSTLAGHLLERMAPVLERLEGSVDEHEAGALSEAPGTLQAGLAELRREVIALRRHLAPQREAMIQLAKSATRTFDEECEYAVHALADQVTRYVEDLDELRERTAVTHDLLAGRHADVMNSRMLLLSIITAVFLPLGLITGLLGINVAGIPGAGDERAFLIVCLLLGLIAGLQLLLLHKLKWF